MEIIEQLKQLIEKRGMTQHQVCCELKCQAASLNRWLLEKSKPGYAWQEVIKNYLKENVDIKQ